MKEKIVKKLLQNGCTNIISHCQITWISLVHSVRQGQGFYRDVLETSFYSSQVHNDVKIY